MWRRLRLVGAVAPLPARFIKTQIFVANVEKVQQQLSTAEKKNDLLQHGRMMFETEVLDDVERAWTPQLAASVCQAATSLRVPTHRGQPLAAVIQHSITPGAIAVMDVQSLARVVHACLVLRHPQLFEVLFSYIRPIIVAAPSIDAVSCAVLINAYGRAQIHHSELYEVLCARSAAVMRDGIASIAHVANVAHALSRVGMANKTLFLVLRDLAVKYHAQGSPLVLVTILDAFAEVGFVDEELFHLFEGIMQQRLEELPAPLMASLLSCLVKAKRASSPLFPACAERAARIGDSFDAMSIAKTCDALFQADCASEEVLGALAERACRVASDFRADEIALTLRALSAFDLFDAELFPLLASRIVSIIKQNGFVDPKDAVSTLASFAAVQERSDELIHVCSQLLVASVDGTDATSMTNALYAFGALNVRSETQRELLERVKTNKNSILTTEEAAAQKLMAERLAVVKKTYGL